MDSGVARFSLCLAFVIGLPLVERPASAGPVTLVGGDEVLWAYRSSVDDATGAEFVRFAYLPARSGLTRFLPVDLTPTGGRIERSAVRGRSLHIFFADGTHLRLRPPSRRPGMPPERCDYPERKLPDAVVPIALCGNDQAGALVAVIQTGIAAKLVSENAETPTTQPAEDVLDNEDTARTQPGDATVPTGRGDREQPMPTRFALARYARGQWEMECQIPAFFDQHSAVWLASYGDSTHLFYSTVPVDPRLMHATLDGTTWGDPKPVPGVSPGDVVCALAWADSVILVLQESNRTAGASGIYAMSFIEGQWVAHDPLELVKQVDHSGRVTVHRMADEIAVATPQEAGRVALGLWPVRGGSPTRVLHGSAALAVTSNQIVGEKARMMIAVALLVGLLMIVFSRRRESFLVDLPAPPGFVLSGIGRRFVAAVIDGMIALPFLYFVFKPWFDAHFDSGAFLATQWNLAIEHYGDRLFVRWLVAVGLYALYGTVFEATLGATPGKLLMGLRVCDDRGSACSFKAVLLRNVLRIVEFYPMMQLAPTLILVVLTRNRQRIGDLLARTIVVQKKRGIPVDE